MLTRVGATCTVTNRPDYSGLLRERRQQYFYCGSIRLVFIKAHLLPAHILLNHCHFIFVLHFCKLSNVLMTATLLEAANSLFVITVKALI